MENTRRRPWPFLPPKRSEQRVALKHRTLLRRNVGNRVDIPVPSKVKKPRAVFVNTLLGVYATPFIEWYFKYYNHIAVVCCHEQWRKVLDEKD